MRKENTKKRINAQTAKRVVYTPLHVVVINRGYTEEVVSNSGKGDIVGNTDLRDGGRVGTGSGVSRVKSSVGSINDFPLEGREQERNRATKLTENLPDLSRRGSEHRGLNGPLQKNISYEATTKAT